MVAPVQCHKTISRKIMQATPEHATMFPLSHPQWAVGTELDLSRLSPGLLKHLSVEVWNEVIREHRRILVGSRRTLLGQKPNFPQIKASLKQGVLRKLAVLESPDKVFIAGVAPTSSEDWVTELSYLETLAKEGSSFSYQLMFIKRLDGRDYAYTYPRPLLSDDEVEVCAIQP
jgi:hypothetical protein